MQVVDVHGQICMTGFRWSSDVKPRSEIIAEAGTEYNRLVQLSHQYGLIQDEANQYKKPVSLAALLQHADAQKVSIYKLHDVRTGKSFYWVLGVWHRISVRTDKSFDNESDAQDFAESVRDTLGLENVENYESEESIARIAKVLSSGVPKEAYAIPLSRYSQARLLKCLAALACAIVLAWGAIQLIEYREQQQRIEAQRQYTRQKEARLADAVANPERHWPSAWMTAPEPSVFVTTVFPQMLRHPLAANGWRLNRLTGSRLRLTATWEQTPFSDYAHLPFSGQLDDKNPKLARSQVAITVLSAKKRTLDDLLPQSEVSAALYGFTHQFGAKIRISFAARGTKKIEKRNIECPWLSGKWELSALPAYLIADYANMASALAIPGVIIQEVVYEDGHWALKGELYAR